MVRRIEDQPLIRGEGTYLDDLTGALSLAVVRSPIAHGRIEGIDAGAAADMPGVRLVLLPSDLPDLIASPRPRPDRRVPARPALAQGVVRYVGQPVAAVVADTAAQAVDAAGVVFADIDPLAVVGDPEAGLTADPIHPEFDDNIATERSSGAPEDLDGLGADFILDGTIEHPRVVPAPLEGRTVRAEWVGDTVTIHWGTQAPVLMRSEVARSFGLREEDVRIVVPTMGGAFGSKFDFAEEEALVIEAARRLQHPVEWIETRSEHMATIGHGRAQRHHFRAAVSSDGRLLGLWVDSIVDIGAFKRYIAGAPVTPRIGVGNYDVGHYAWRQRSVFTNRAPRGIYRGAGRPEATLTIERIMDLIAARLELDPAEVRRRNFITDFPHEVPGGWVYDSGDYGAALDQLLEAAGYQALRERQARARAEGRLLGIGLAAYVEACGFEDSERAEARIEPDGTVVVSVGTLDHGQGHFTTFAELVAAELGVDRHLVDVRQGDTDEIPFGSGTSGSRSAAHGGSSAVGAAKALAAEVRAVAASLLGCEPDEVTLHDGVADGPGGDAVKWDEIAAASQVTADRDPGLPVSHDFTSGGLMFPYGIHLAVVEVDEQTGVVDLRELWALDDSGVILNPMIADGQRHGGIAQGLGQALWEQVVYDEDGNLLTGSFAAYMLPAADQMPGLELRRRVTPTPHNPLGAKGIAESGAIGIVPAVVNAVIDALSPRGVEHLDVPLQPHTIWTALQG